MTASIYDQHRSAFSSVSAYIVFLNNAKVATIAFKYPRDGAGRLYAYVHWLGVPMVRGFASGGGYDKHSAACAHASSKIPASDPIHDDLTTNKENQSRFIQALSLDDGFGWDRNLRSAGFEVLQAV